MIPYVPENVHRNGDLQRWKCFEVVKPQWSNVTRYVHLVTQVCIFIVIHILYLKQRYPRGRESHADIILRKVYQLLALSHRATILNFTVRCGRCAGRFRSLFRLWGEVFSWHEDASWKFRGVFLGRFHVWLGGKCKFFFLCSGWTPFHRSARKKWNNISWDNSFAAMALVCSFLLHNRFWWILSVSSAYGCPKRKCFFVLRLGNTEEYLRFSAGDTKNKVFVNRRIWRNICFRYSTVQPFQGRFALFKHVKYVNVREFLFLWVIYAYELWV